MTEITAAPTRTSLAAVKAPPVLTTALQQVRTIAAQPAVAKSLPALGLLALIAAAALIWMTFSTPPSRDLFRGLPDEDKGAVVDALKTGGIRYRIGRDTGNISVSDDDYHQARMLLAQQGLPKSAPDGDDLIKNLPLGASRAVEGERLRTARELDLARTIEAIDAVQTARVHLAVQPPSAFLRDQDKPSAAVMLTLKSGRTLGEQQVQAIVHLIASSVPGMAPEGVSVADQDGHLLSSEDAGGLTEAAERQVQVQNKIEERYRQAVEALLTPILGAGNFTTQVHADLDFSETQATRDSYPKDSSTLRTEEGAVTSQATDAPAGGIPGALSNQPPAAAQASTTPPAAVKPAAPAAPAATPAAAVSAPGTTPAAPRTENYVRNFAVGHEVSVTHQQSGEVKRVSVAIAIRNPAGSKPRSPAELAALEQLVKGAVGYDQSRGDLVALSARNFAPVDAPAPSWWEAGWVSLLARNLTALAIVALLLFGAGRPLAKWGSATLKHRTQLRVANRSAMGGEIAAAIATETRTSRDPQITLSMIEGAPSYEARASLIRSFVRQDPARAALVVRDLIRADSTDGDKNG
ncbi:MAG TPA: flagellar basal-body MS-ring/collar protein FliF [Allosphingosinicella sp.]|nr:flagellar basal-body MS-ring/collar protein FliF [Allosphingosinicella sp.]